jgi:hypothetical protein
VLQTVAGSAVVGKSYQDVLGMIKTGGRPLAMTFIRMASRCPTVPICTEALDTSEDSD